MPTFKYTAIDKTSGKVVAGNIEAYDPDDAVHRVRCLGVFPTFVKELLLPDTIPASVESNILNIRLCDAVWNQNVEMVIQLIDSGADLNCFAESGNTPLHLSVEQQDVKIATILLDRGADINKRTEMGGWTPLIHAVCAVCVCASTLHKEPDNQIIRLLLENEADPSLTCKGMTALDDAREYTNNSEAVTLLEQAMLNGKRV